MVWGGGEIKVDRGRMGRGREGSALGLMKSI